MSGLSQEHIEKIKRINTLNKSIDEQKEVRRRIDRELVDQNSIYIKGHMVHAHDIGRVIKGIVIARLDSNIYKLEQMLKKEL